MDINKLDITQVCILCTKSIADGRIGEFFLNRGAITHDFKFKGDNVGSYYFSDGKVILSSNKMPEFRKIINPWKKPRRKFPREMMVSDNGIDWHSAEVLCKLKTEYPFISRHHRRKTLLKGWKFAKEIKSVEPMTVEQKIQYIKILSARRQTKKRKDLICFLNKELENEFLRLMKEID